MKLLCSTVRVSCQVMCLAKWYWGLDCCSPHIQQRLLTSRQLYNMGNRRPMIICRRIFAELVEVNAPQFSTRVPIEGCTGMHHGNIISDKDIPLLEVEIETDATVVEE